MFNSVLTIIYLAKKRNSTIRGFILNVRKAGNEDSIAVVLGEQEVRSYYRFYGARHSILQLGNLVDFEVEGEDGRFLPRIRSLSHIGFPWLFDKNRLLIWHNFIRLFEPHLRDAEEIDRFYFDLLLDGAKRWNRQNPKRVVCESYVKLLRHEGRIHMDEQCYICENSLGEEISLMQSLIPAHPECLYSAALSKRKIFDFFESKKTVFLDDDEVEYLFAIIMKGF